MTIVRTDFFALLNLIWTASLNANRSWIWIPHAPLTINVAAATAGLEMRLVRGAASEQTCLRLRQRRLLQLHLVRAAINAKMNGTDWECKLHFLQGWDIGVWSSKGVNALHKALTN